MPESTRATCNGMEAASGIFQREHARRSGPDGPFVYIDRRREPELLPMAWAMVQEPQSRSWAPSHRLHSHQEPRCCFLHIKGTRLAVTFGPDRAAQYCLLYQMVSITI